MAELQINLLQLAALVVELWKEMNFIILKASL